MSIFSSERPTSGPVASVSQLFLGGLILFGCGEEVTPRVVQDPIAEGLLPADWMGPELGVALPAFVEVGKIERASKEEAADDARIPFATDTFEHTPENELALFDLGRSRRFDVTLSEGTDRVAAARAKQLADAAAKDPQPTEPSGSAGPKLITGGADTRIMMGLAQGVGLESWMAAVGILSPAGGTGTLISSNVAITAAHFLFSKSGKHTTDSFQPRADIDDSYAPWGDWPITHIEVPAAFMNNKCYEERHPVQCEQYDIAFLRLSRPAEAQNHRWYFALAAETRALLSTRELRNRGYPTCYEDDPPPMCDVGMSHTLFGDARPCALGPDRSSDQGDFSPNIFHGCDTNDGHSGGPMFYYQSYGSPVLIGIHLSSYPNFASATNNLFKRFSPNTLQWIHGML